MIKRGRTAMIHAARMIVSSSFVLWSAACGASQPATGARPATPISLRTEVVGQPGVPLLIEGVGFMTPESVLYDPIADEYLVSNIEGSPLDADDKAFISRLAPDGRVLALKWIDSASPDVALDAPKGMALFGEVLYVADITQVRKFHRKTGRPLGSVKVEGSTFLNDVAAAADGSIYVSDSGLTTGFAPSGTDSVTRITADGQVTTVVRDRALGRPNGLLAAADGIWAVSFGSGELYRIDATGKRSEIRKLPKGSLDGIVMAGTSMVISSWEASALYRADGDGFEAIVEGLDAPADIGFDTRRQRVLVPLFNQNAVAIHQL